MERHSRLTAMTASAVVVFVSMSLSGCGPAAESQPTKDNPVTINMWGWDTHLPAYIEQFEKEHPEIRVKLTNAGQASKQYISLNNAISAGSGIPDVAMIEYYALPQYISGGSLKSLNDFGAGSLEDEFFPGVWSQVQYDGGVYALPAGSGALALFYNKEVYDQAGVTRPPSNWDEYLDAARKIHALGDDYYITTVLEDGSGTLESMIWAAGGKPFSVSGSSAGVNLTSDKPTQRLLDWQQQLLDEHLVDTGTTMWSEEWYRKLLDGKIASLTNGIWMGTMLEGNLKGGSGKWRVAPVPSMDGSTKGNGENGGAAWAILSASKHQQAAYTFVKYLASSDWVTSYQQRTGQFPAYLKALEDADFVNATSDYFGGQQVNKEYIAAAKAVGADWQFLPYDSYARTIYADYLGKVLQGDITYRQAVEEWQDDLVEYGRSQGFTIADGS